MNSKRLRIRSAKAQFLVRQHVRISKGKPKFGRSSEHNVSTAIFRTIIVVYGTPRIVYELEDLNVSVIDGQLYAEELTPVRISKRTMYHTDKITKKRYRQGILEYLPVGEDIQVLFSRGSCIECKKYYKIMSDDPKNLLRDIVQYRLTSLPQQH